MLKIVRVPNAILTSSVKPVSIIDEKIKKLVYEMEETLIAQDDPPGVGLAAPQVGKNLAIFIIKPTEKAKTQAFINPRVLKLETRLVPRSPAKRDEVGNSKLKTNKKKNPKSKNLKLEGCLSLPRIWGPVRRANKLLLEYQDLNGAVKKEWFGGLSAIIIQHEIDHLNGVLFTQKALEQNLPLYEEKNGELEKMDY